jgi:hypothetical protein
MLADLLAQYLGKAAHEDGWTDCDEMLFDMVAQGVPASLRAATWLRLSIADNLSFGGFF